MQKEKDLTKLIDSIQELVRITYIRPQKLSNEYDLTLPQSDVLKTLIMHGPLFSAALSRKLYVTPSNITGVIDRLEKKKLVQRVRSKEDRRVYLISLTDKGKEIAESLPDPLEKKIWKNLDGLDKEEISYLSRAVDHITGLIKEHNE